MRLSSTLSIFPSSSMHFSYNYNFPSKLYQNCKNCFQDGLSNIDLVFVFPRKNHSRRFCTTK
jgi:hypothetical protein